MSKRPKVLISDPLPSHAREILEESGGIDVLEMTEGWQQHLGEIQGWVVRSGTQITAELLEQTPNLQCVCRAGAGVDNIDVEAATRHGVVVMNTPGSNSMAAAEQTVALMLSLARNIPFAHATMMQGGWGRKNYVGVEVEGKCLGVIGLGRVGRIVARKGRGLGMTVMGYDPFVSADLAAEWGIELASVEEVMAKSDFLALHTPLTDATRGLVNAKSLGQCKKGVRIINCSRGGVVDEEALLEAVNSGQVAGAALDVFSSEPPPEDFPLRNHPRIITTPHLGASTVEAQDQVSVASGRQVRDFLLKGTVVNAVNTASLAGDDRERYLPFVALARRLGSLQAQVLDEQPSSVHIEIEAQEGHDILEKLVVDNALVGFLAHATDAPLNTVNARFMARERGVDLNVKCRTGSTAWTRSLRMDVNTASGTRHTVGAVLGDGAVRLVRFDEYDVDGLLEGPIIITTSDDRPGMVGRLGTLLGDEGVNIANLSLGRDQQGGKALAIFNLDAPAPSSVIEKLRAMDGIVSAMFVDISD